MFYVAVHNTLRQGQVPQFENFQTLSREHYEFQFFCITESGTNMNKIIIISVLASIAASAVWLAPYPFESDFLARILTDKTHVGIGNSSKSMENLPSLVNSRRLIARLDQPAVVKAVVFIAGESAGTTMDVYLQPGTWLVPDSVFSGPGCVTTVENEERNGK